LRKAWQTRLDDAGIIIRDHSIVRPDVVEARAPPVQVARHKTAIPRSSLSLPMQMFARYGFFDAYPHVFDFGCGQGDDLRVLEHAGVTAAGWDPHFRPGAKIRSADLVNLGFVLNVIEFPDERRSTLKKAWALCRKVLAVAVMVEGHYSVQGLKPFGDGFLTSRGTFQKYFAPHELRAFVRETLDVEPVAIAPGIVLIFRDGAEEQEFLFRRRKRVPPTGTLRIPPAQGPTVRRVAEPLPERLRPLLERLWARATEMGRPPEADEMPDTADALAGSNVSMQRALRWCQSFFDQASMESAARRLREDLLVHFALGAFSGSSRRLSPRPDTFSSRWGNEKSSMRRAEPLATTGLFGNAGKTASISKGDGWLRRLPLSGD
jgi:DNA phosphorothioation-associated putative methyltransferase